MTTQVVVLTSRRSVMIAMCLGIVNRLVPVIKNG